MTKKYEKIVSIKEIDEIEMIDIEVDGDHYFYANDILTHNSSSEPDMTSTAESFGLPATADFMAAIVVNEELIELDQYLFIQLKNRFKDLNTHKKFIVGVNRSRMRLHDVEAQAQVTASKADVPDDIPVMDRKTKFQQLKVHE